MNDGPSRRSVLGLTSGAITAGLAGCVTGSDRGESTDDADEDTADHGDGSHGRESHGTDLDGPSADAEVTMTTTESGDHFEPHVVWIETGGSVTWTNESGNHSATAYGPENDEPQLVPDGAAAWDSGVLSEPDATFDHAFEIEGVYHYYCTPHETSGMIGSVIVGQPAPDGQPPLEEPPSEKPETVRQKLASLNETVRDALGDDHGDDDGHDDHDHDH